MPLLVTLVAGCSREDTATPVAPTEVQYNQTTAAELRAAKGEPAKVSIVPRPRDLGRAPQSESTASAIEVWQYADGRYYQVDGGIVLASWRAPTNPEERTLQYWRQLWRGRAKTFEVVPGSAGPHTQGLWRLTLVGGGESVIFDADAGVVVEVRSHGP